jgi:EAL domain-containing protein (putative c-di-GMP-specific phosphodiesterase class I)
MDIAKTFIHQDGHKVFCTASIGAGLFEKTQSLRTGLQFTDLLMREAKTMGRNCYVIGDPITIQKLKNDGKFTSKREIQNALEDQEIEYFVQPIVDAVSGRILGFEALARWIKSNGEIFEPKKFIDILYLTVRQPKYFKLKTRMRSELLKALEKYPNQYLSFNMKIELLSHENAAQEIHESILGSIGSETIQNREIILELSERAITERTNSDLVIKQLEKLKSIGYRIALDDFGIKSSNIQRLQDYPIDIVKVDRRFIKKIGIDDRADLILSAVIKLVTTLNLKIIIEGVETESQRQKLLSMGTPFHQGFLYCKPVAVKTLAEATKHLSL